MKLKGSMTVEAAGIIPVVLLVVFSMIYLCFFVHNRVWLTAAACESAECGSITEALREGEGEAVSRTRSVELGSTGFFGAENLTAGTAAGRRLTVMYDADTLEPRFSIRWRMHAEGSALLQHPAKEVRERKPYRIRRE